MEATVYIAAVLIGVSLASLGGGGAILTVPVFVYLLHVDPMLATTYSLFVVGACSLVGGVRAFLAGLVDLPVTLYFGSTSLLTVFLVRYFVVAAIPEKIVAIGRVDISRDFLFMTLFAALMLAVAFFIIRAAFKKPAGSAGEPSPSRPAGVRWIGVFGILAGTITGLLGAGGGFLIIPALVLFGKLPMKIAVGSSLTIIACNSFLGFFSSFTFYTIDWPRLLTFTSIAVTGIFLGGFLSGRIPGDTLKTGFGWFVLIVGLAVLARELLMLQ